MTPTYKLQELADEAGIAPRTVRYYVQRGLLPAPEFRGKDTAYGREHLLRLQVIKRLQQAHLPLDEIQSHLMNATEAYLLRLLQEEVPGYGSFEEPLRDSGTVTKQGHPYRTSGRPESSVGSSNSSPEPFSTPTASTARVYYVAPGVELLVREDAPTASLALVRDILNGTAIIHDDKDADQ